MISGYFCVEEWLKYKYPGGIFVLDSVLQYDVKVKNQPSMPIFSAIYQKYHFMLAGFVRPSPRYSNTGYRGLDFIL